jgi:formylglycine-generating enzyme required for sulfatase activity
MRFLFVTVLTAVGLSAAVDFNAQIKPILVRECIACHGPERPAGSVQLDTRTAATKGSTLVPGKPDASLLYLMLELKPGQPKAMPPGKQLPQAERDLIKQWIAEGAVWPADAILGAAASSVKIDEKTAVARLHSRIAAQKPPASMTAYKGIIPNTDVSFEMMPIAAGEFTMGTPDTESVRRKDEGPQRKVKIDAFWMGKHEVTWDEYRLFMFSNMAKEDVNKDEVVDAISRPTRPYVEMSFGMGINGFPAISMTQHAANQYAEWLSAKTGQFYRLPTEAEWEYACRAGTTTAYSFGDDASKLSEYAWHAGNSDGKYGLVGKKKPNPWGLHDMHGNVMEWTLDQYSPKGYAGVGSDNPSDNPWNVATEPYPHAVRGGSWMDPAAQLRCGARVASDPSWKQQDPQLPKSIWYHTDAQGLGFRLVRPVKTPTAEQMYKYWNNGVQDEP